MIRCRSISVLTFTQLLLLSSNLLAATGSRKPQTAQAVSILNSCVTASGGATAIASIQDFTASGTITYNWAYDRCGTIPACS